VRTDFRRQKYAFEDAEFWPSKTELDTRILAFKDADSTPEFDASVTAVL
jgi:hypothetical protein